MADKSERLIVPDYCAKYIDDVAREENFIEYELSCRQGSCKGDNYLGEIVQISLTGEKRSGKNASKNFILKVAPKYEELRKRFPVNVYYNREVFAYTKLLPCFDDVQKESDIPYDERVHHVQYYRGSAEESKEMILMENLKVKGYKLYDVTNSFDLNHLSLGVKILARFHAASFVLKSKNPILYEELTIGAASKIEVSGDIENLFALRKDVVLSLLDEPSDFKKINEFYDKIPSLYTAQRSSQTAEPYNVLCHGDYRSHNILFSYKDGQIDDLIMLDWQLLRHASPVTDLSYFIFLGTDESTREKYYNRMIDLYYEELSNRVKIMGVDISTCYPEYIYREHIKTTMSFGPLMSILILHLIFPKQDVTFTLDDAISKKENVTLHLSEMWSERMKGILKDLIKYNMLYHNS